MSDVQGVISNTKKKDLKIFVKHVYFRPGFTLCFNKERRHYILLLLGLSVRSSTLSHLPSQPTQPPPVSDIGYNVITGAESLSQSRRLYYDKVDAPGFLKDRSSSLSSPLSPS